MKNDLFDLRSKSDRIAVISEDGTNLSYQTLLDRVEGFASQFNSSRSVVLVHTDNSVDAIIAYLGTIYSGNIPILCPAHSDTERLKASFSPEYTVKNGLASPTFLGAPPTIPTHTDLALLLSTSGTTGSLKLVRLSYQNIISNAQSIINYLGICERDRAITTLPFHYSFGLSIINTHLLAGASIVLTSRSVTDPVFWTLFTEHGVSSLSGVPYTYELLEKIGFRSKHYKDLRYLTQAGGRLPPTLVSDFDEWARSSKKSFFVMYGQTEATARMAYVPPHLLHANPDCIGIAIPGGRFSIIDTDGSEISATNVPGELVYEGANVMLGYATSRSDLSLGRMVNKLHTGDLAEWTPSGMVRLTGRASRFSKIFGLRLAHDEIESFLRANGRTAYVVGNDDLIYILCIDANETERLALQEKLAQKYRLPSSKFRVDGASTPPLLSSGKIDYAKLKAHCQGLSNQNLSKGSGQASNAPSPPLLLVFQKAFSGKNVELSDSFVSLGGDSLSFVEVSDAIERHLGYLPPSWQRLSISELTRLDRRSLGSFSKIPAEVLIRFIAILGVIGTHASDLPLGGGASLLFLVSGFNFFRYQFPHLVQGQFRPVIKGFLVGVILPYYIVVLSYLFYKQELSLATLMLVSNLSGRTGSFLEPFWYVECLTQVVFLLCAIFTASGVRAIFSSSTMLGFLGLFSVSVVLYLVLGSFGLDANLALRVPTVLFPLFILGSMLAMTMDSRLRFIVFSLGLVTVLMMEEFEPRHQLWILSGFSLLCFAPQVSVPRHLARIISIIGGSSYFIYLTHMIVVHLSIYFAPDHKLPLSLIIAPLLGIACLKSYSLLSKRIAAYAA